MAPRPSASGTPPRPGASGVDRTTRAPLNAAGAGTPQARDRVVPGRSVPELDLGGRPAGATRPFTSSPATRPMGSTLTRPGGAPPRDASGPGDASRPDSRPPHRTTDPRYVRPTAAHVHATSYAIHRPPVVHTYRPYYTRWYCHPWYRYRYSTWAVVSFDFVIYPWYAWWVPPARYGWAWSPGYWDYGYWHPGYWAPVSTAPIGYAYVPGWWEDEVYVEGYYRVEQRDSWTWVDGYYLDDGTYVRGHWMPDGAGPEGYVWEAGFWDGESYVDGFWRPEYRGGFAWIDAYYDGDGIYHSGYWMPLEEEPGKVWIPGWFDGSGWIDGYWVDESEVTEEAVESWVPPEGYDEGWDEEVDPRTLTPEEAPPAKLIQKYRDESGEEPLALPVVPQE
jgi:hypothetical protein